MIFLQNTSSLFRSCLKETPHPRKANKQSQHSLLQKTKSKLCKSLFSSFPFVVIPLMRFRSLPKAYLMVHDTRCARQREPLHASSAFAHGCTHTIALPSIKEELNKQKLPAEPWAWTSTPAPLPSANQTGRYTFDMILLK